MKKQCSVVLAVILTASMQLSAFALDVGTIRPGSEVRTDGSSASVGTYTDRSSGQSAPDYTPRGASASSSVSKVYTWEEIPEDWVIPLKKNGVRVGYAVVVPGGGTASFKLSGDDFASVRVKQDSAYGDAIALTEGKTRTIKDVKVVRVYL